ncbi:hypothetical protein CVD28_01135 [Bacillus sp. M6-12]|uniref:hypothetical protein n=1 Tax=Bacillus sp. M6-12 TaxID=2054166 RepID=UPI000C767E59|nr:hypothetical protein [Bacillus sp. M6-12]PLS19038.1 hypothetical protein CVD28_01135 [Bacillus sp. M6-12]
MLPHSYYIAKRKRKKFRLDKKMYRDICDLTKQIWESQEVENCKLFINKKGNSALVHGGFDKSGTNAIMIGLSQDYEHYEKLVLTEQFKGSFLQLVKFTIYHEIGHQKDTLLATIKQERSKIRRSMFQAPDKETWEKLRDEVWKKTYELEMNAWNYVLPYLSMNEKEDFNAYVQYCIKGHKEDWYQHSCKHFGFHFY